MDEKYIRIESTIKKTFFGIIEKTDRIMEISNNISDKFKDNLWNNYLIDINEIECDLT